MNANNTSSSSGGGMATSSTMAPTIGSTSFSTPVAVGLSSTFSLRHDVPLVFLGLAIMFVFSKWLENKTDAVLADADTIPQQGQSNYDYHNNRGNDDSNSVNNVIQKLSMQDWVFLYNKTFDSNDNHQLVLKAEHIVNTESKSKEQLQDNDGGSAKSSGHSNNIGEGFEDVESGKDIDMNRTIHDDDDDTPKTYSVLETVAERNHSSRSLPCLSSSTNARSSSSSSDETNTTPISGSCVICFDDFATGDFIVSSSSQEEGTSTNDDDWYCQHLYHQECMILCLASHSHRKFRKNHPKRKVLASAGDIENSCPTCRRNFCTISDEDLAVVIKTKFLENGSGSITNGEPQGPSTSTPTQPMTSQEDV
jgi:hypothetical protein